MSEGLSRRAALGALWAPGRKLRRDEDEFLERLSRASFLYLWEKANPETGLVLDRALASGAPDPRNVASAAATGFALSGLCIAASRGWMDAQRLRERALKTLRFYAERSPHERGWFYHFVDAATGERVWKCELSSIDSTLLLAGVLTVKQCFRDREIAQFADAIYRRIDWTWMCNSDPRGILTMGWKPESGFLRARWDHYCELLVLYVLGIGAPSKMALPASSWTAWRRPKVRYGDYEYISGAPTLFTHQYSHAWVDFRGLIDRSSPETVDWFENSVHATRAHRAFCVDLGKGDFPGCYDERLWGITASDSAKGYVAWGGPPRHPRIDGTLVPCAAGGSLMFDPASCVETLMEMERRFGQRVWTRYGFVDAFHPVNGWTNPDVLGIDVGITLLSAENARTGRVWRWFMRNAEVTRALSAAQIKRR